MIRATQSYFEGDWLMVRIIEKAPEGLIGEVWGEARFVKDGDGLACHETGVLRFHGEDFHTERTSLWRFPAAGRVEVLHEDGRPFHHFLTERPIALEFSGEASYEIVYEFEPDTWISRWEMAEPGRTYMMTTRYRRCRTLPDRVLPAQIEAPPVDVEEELYLLTQLP
jgi:hypothetical protein